MRLMEDYSNADMKRVPAASPHKRIRPVVIVVGVAATQAAYRQDEDVFFIRRRSKMIVSSCISSRRSYRHLSGCYCLLNAPKHAGPDPF